MDNFTKFQRAIDGAKNIIVTTHTFPDADGIGSQIALTMALRKIGKNCLSVNEVPLLERYKYLDPEDLVLSLEEFKKRDLPVDLILVVDTNTIKRAGSEIEAYALDTRAKIFYIDHHPCKMEIKDDHCIDTKAAATGELVGELIKRLGLVFTKEMGLALYTAIIIDTSSFRYPTVTGNTHRLVSELLATGIEPPEAYNGIYGTKKVRHLHLLSEVLKSGASNKSEEISWIVIDKHAIEVFKSDIEDTHAFINHLLVLDNIKIACMFREDDDFVKLSMRSTGEYDVGSIAVALGGGGHSHSAATILKKEGRTLNEVIEDTVSKMEKII